MTPVPPDSKPTPTATAAPFQEKMQEFERSVLSVASGFFSFLAKMR
jgi:hypothetical protein